MKVLSFFFFLVTFLSFCTAIDLPRRQVTDVIQTKYGPVRGEVVEGVKVFRGVPFAAPPVGELRFESPQPPTPWSQVRDCFEQQSFCPQKRFGSELGSEDCLYLDIYVPLQVNESNPVPVMFFIHGGGWMDGDNWYEGLYDGKNVSRNRGVVVVSTNYRLGAFGFLALSELQLSSAVNSTGNYGLQDQRAALAFVQDNIRNFGGDENKVLLFGESAGAFSVCVQLTSPSSVRNGRKLFHAAILESGNCQAHEFYVPLRLADSFSADFVASAGCKRENFRSAKDFLDCLRKLPQKSLQKLQWPLPGTGYRSSLSPGMPWGAAIDSSPSGLLDRPYNLFNSQKWLDVPVIMGTNHNEGSVFLYSIPDMVPGVTLPLTDKSFNLTMLHFFNQNQTYVELVWQMYPKYLYKSNDARTAVILRDFFFVCDSRKVVRAIAASKQSPAYLYHFTYKGDWPEDPILGDYHSAELEFVFDNPWPPIVHAFSKRDHEMSNVFGTFWSSQAFFANPNGFQSPYPSWPIYSNTSDMNIVMDIPPTIQQNLYSAQCNFWDQFPSQYQ